MTSVSYLEVREPMVRNGVPVMHQTEPIRQVIPNMKTRLLAFNDLAVRNAGDIDIEIQVWLVKLKASIIPQEVFDLALQINNAASVVDTNWNIAGVLQHQRGIGFGQLLRDAEKTLKACRDTIDKNTHARLLQWCVNEMSFAVMKIRGSHVHQRMTTNQ
jgi:hypothetical protein